MRTWFKNANEWNPITSWLGGFNPKVPGTWGWRPPRTEGLRGAEPPNFFVRILMDIYFAYVPDDFRYKNKCLFFVAFLIFLESSETHFDLINNLVIYGDVLVNYLWILRTKSTISKKKQKITKIGKIVFFSVVLEHCHTLWYKNPIWPLLRGGGVCLSLTGNNTEFF